MVSVIYILLESNSKISASLNSIIHQTHRDIEIIIVGNEKVHEHQELIDKLITKGAPITTYYLKNNNSHLYAALYGARKANGKYLFFISATDYVYQNYLELLIRKMDADDAIEISTAGFARYNSKRKERHLYKEEVLEDSKKFDPKEIALYRLWNSVIRKDFLISSLTAEDLETYNSTSFILSILVHCRKYYRHGDILYFRGSPPEKNQINVERYINSAEVIKQVGLPKNIYYLFLLDELLVRSALSLLPLKGNQESIARLIEYVRSEIPHIRRFILFMKRSFTYRRACLALVKRKYQKAEKLLNRL